MSMEDILKALMQSAGSQQPSQQGAGGDAAMAQMLGGMLGGGQPQGGAGADTLSQALGGMLGAGQGQGGGNDMLTQAIGGLLGGQQAGGGAGTGALLGGLQQILGGTPGTGQTLAQGGVGSAMTSGNPIMMLLQPVINQLAAKLGISPQIATTISSIALYYLVQSSPNTPGASPLNLGSVMQSLAAGKKVSPTALQKSGIVGDVVQATGMTEQQAVKSLSATFGIMGSQLTPVRKVSGTKGVKSARGVRGKATVTRRRK